MKWFLVLALSLFLTGCSHTQRSNIPVPSPEQESLSSESDDLNLDVLEAELQDIQVDDLDLNE